MPLRQDVQDAFATLGLTPDADIAEATKVYKRLALLHHPDRNHGDSNATQRFQQISHAWDICQRYYDNPAWASRSDGRYYPDDDDVELDDEDLFEFYMFMFAETLFNRYSHASRRQYKNESFSHRTGPVVFTFGPSSSEYSQDKNAARQRKEKEEYERRKRELELEVEREEREAKEQAKKQKADVDRLAGAHERAFQAAHSGNPEEVQRLVKEFNLDVTAPRNLRSAKNPRKQDDNPQFETLLHAAACQCDENLFMFLVEKGANPGVLNKQQLSPFHVAIKAGNSKLVRCILERRGKSFQDYHPSKATPSGITPLQLAIESSDLPTIELLVKHATTHDVDRCWRQIDLPEEIKGVLRTKKGFVPPGEGLESVPARAMSKKCQRQQETALQKEARIAEETRRAEINRQRKEERAARRAVIEREKTAREEEENRRRKVEGEETALQSQEEIHRAEVEARIKELEEERLRVEAEAKAALKLEQAAKERTERETGELVTASEHAKVEEERLEEQRLEQERLRTEQEERQRVEQERKETERIVREKIGRERKGERIARQESEEARRQEEGEEEAEEEAKTQPEQVSVPTRSMSERKKPGRNVHAEEQRRELRRENLRERRKTKREEQKVASSAAPPSQPKASGSEKAKPPVDLKQMDERQRNKYEQMMKRRAEQSARDKERHRRMMEERKKAQSDSQTQSEPSEYVPLTPVSTDAARSDQSPMVLKPTVSSFNAPPFMEDIQTCIVPDDLFREAKPEGEGFGKRIYGSQSPEPTNPNLTRKPYRRFFRQHHPKRATSG